MFWPAEKLKLKLCIWALLSSVWLVPFGILLSLSLFISYSLPLSLSQLGSVCRCLSFLSQFASLHRLGGEPDESLPEQFTKCKMSASLFHFSSPHHPLYPPPAPSHLLSSHLEDSRALPLRAAKEPKLSAGKSVKWKNLIALREKPSLFICKFLGHAFFPPSPSFHFTVPTVPVCVWLTLHEVFLLCWKDWLSERNNNFFFWGGG